MLNFEWIDWLILTLVPIIALILGIKRNRPSGWVDYFLARSRLSSIGTISNYIGANLAFTAIFLVITLEASRRGWWVLAVPIAWMIGTFLLIGLYPRIRPYLERGETLHQALGREYDNSQTDWHTVRRWASLWTIIAFVGTVALEFYGGILLLEWVRVPQLAKLTLAVILAFICAVFTVRGGLRGVAIVNGYLDVVSAIGITILFGFILKAVFGSSITPASPVVSEPVSTADSIVYVIASFLIFIPVQICALDTWQRGIAWRERKNVKGTLIAGAVFIVIASCVAIAAGTFVQKNGLLTPPGGHPLLTLLTALNIPSIFIGLIIAGFLAAILSTADELLNCCGYAVLADFLNLPRSDVSDDVSSKYIRSGKFYTGLFAFISAGLAVLGLELQKQISDIAYVVFATQVVFIFPILFALYSKQPQRLHRGALIAMLLAFLLSLGMTLLGWSDKENGQALIDGAPLLAFLTAGVVMGVSWLFARRRSI